MGAQWKQKWRELTSNKKGQVVGKLVREIQVAVQQGGTDPDMNARLYAALEKARRNSVTRDTIERAIKTGSGQGGEKTQLETVIYEGFTPHKIPVMVEALTDNRNRTGPEIRMLFKTGALGTPGSVGFFFEHMGVVEAVHPEASREAEDDAIEAGAQNVEELDPEEIPEGHIGATFLTDTKELAAVSKALAALGWKLQASELRYLAKTFPDLTEEQQSEVGAFLSALDDHSDVHRVYAAFK
ncbi:MAG: hypothetical protein JWL81_1689 [Verrucomicrobiales bacterium]|nr:hypothetical protein [Verrucomicrobiales bacterium]